MVAQRGTGGPDTAQARPGEARPDQTRPEQPIDRNDNVEVTSKAAEAAAAAAATVKHNDDRS